MPIIDISLAEGRTDEQLRDLMQRVHNAVEEWGAPASSIRVLVREVPPTQWLSGGTTLAELRGVK
ncbi:4-oxalocrotonate tautomerase family protein [Cryobacterium sp. SO2]|uniref:tautomerase family protein n=1 Tax=Cryobacterium sp. SO2 TaxID=1897060 RepID=UPI00223DE704|nr:4-oxalocrotonate tautomerase family protein [Cryobacterium sp. SO2]WEO75973.1 4-oxalocrotonate tautomerase family protein [Cryobacterium sp. SO2]